MKEVWAGAAMTIMMLSGNLACKSSDRDPNTESTSPVSSKASVILDTIKMSIAGTTVTLEVAKERETLSRGLMFRDSLAKNSGMLFIFPREGMYSFWMKNTRIPLSIAFINSQGRIVGLDEMRPYDTVTVHMPFEPYTYAIEMDSGWFSQNGVRKGDMLKIPSSGP